MKCTLKHGLTLSLNGAGMLKIEGDQVVVEKWLPIIKEHKQALLTLLQPENGLPSTIPLPCLDCSKLEVINILGVDVPGCLYKIAGNKWSEGWKRLPTNLERCIWR